MKLMTIIIALLFAQISTVFSQQRVRVITIPKNSVGDVKRYFGALLLRTVQSPSRPVGLIEARNQFWRKTSFTLNYENEKYSFSVKDSTNNFLLSIPLTLVEGSGGFSSDVILSEIVSMEKKELLIRNFLANSRTPLSVFEMSILATILLENKIIFYQP